MRKLKFQKHSVISYVIIFFVFASQYDVTLFQVSPAIILDFLICLKSTCLVKKNSVMSQNVSLNSRNLSRNFLPGNKQPASFLTRIPTRILIGITYLKILITTVWFCCLIHIRVGGSHESIVSVWSSYDKIIFSGHHFHLRRIEKNRAR